MTAELSPKQVKALPTDALKVIQSDLRKKLAAFTAATACPARSAAVTDISNACEACHRDYK